MSISTLPAEIKTTEDFQDMVNYLNMVNSDAAKCAVYNLNIAKSIGVGRWNIANNMLHSVKTNNLQAIINTAKKHGYSI